MRKLAIFAVFVFAILVSGCGSPAVPEQGASTSVADENPIGNPETPTEVYLAYIDAIEEGDYIKAQSFLSSSTVAQLTATATALGKTLDVVLEEMKFKMDMTGYQQIDKSQITDEIEGNRAKVIMNSKPGETPFTGYYSLFKEDGKWKLAESR